VGRWRRRRRRPDMGRGKRAMDGAAPDGGMGNLGTGRYRGPLRGSCPQVAHTALDHARVAHSRLDSSKPSPVRSASVREAGFDLPTPPTAPIDDEAPRPRDDPEVERTTEAVTTQAQAGRGVGDPGRGLSARGPMGLDPRPGGGPSRVSCGRPSPRLLPAPARAERGFLQGQLRPPASRGGPWDGRGSVAGRAWSATPGTL
jgi:hypothetical protein